MKFNTDLIQTIAPTYICRCHLSRNKNVTIFILCNNFVVLIRISYQIHFLICLLIYKNVESIYSLQIYFLIAIRRYDCLQLSSLRFKSIAKFSLKVISMFILSDSTRSHKTYSSLLVKFSRGSVIITS